MRSNLGFIGAGNMSQAIIAGLIRSGSWKADQIFVSNRTPGKLQKVVEAFGVQPVSNNEEVVEKCHTIILGVKPQDLGETIEPLSNIVEEHHQMISLAAGVSLAKLKKMVPQTDLWVRIMPNLTARMTLSATGFFTESEDQTFADFVEDLFSTVGPVYRCEDEDQFDSLMVACSSGIGFVLELMVYWQEWLEEHGFSTEGAKAMTIQTFLGAATFAKQESTVSLTDLINQVASKKGVTQAGLDSMREMETERTLRLSFEKAALRTQEIGKSLK